MIRIQILYFFLLFSPISILSAQTKEDTACGSSFAIINDPDGYTNVRDENKKIIGEIYKDEIFAVSMIDDPINKYQPILWKLNDRNEETKTGYIHVSRIKYLCQLPLLKRQIRGNSAIFKNDSIKIIINIGTFNINSRRIVKYPGTDYPTKIDGYKTWGADCISTNYPNLNTEIKSIEYTINGLTYQIEKKDFAGYLFPSLENAFIYLGSNDILYIAMNNGDGAGSYSLLWVLKKGKIIKKIVYTDL